MNIKLRALSTLSFGLLACFSLVNAANAAAAVEKAKPVNRLVAKAKPQTAVAPLPPDEPAVLSEDQLAVAPRVHHGDVPCEFNQKVSITPHPEQPGRFHLRFGKMVYNMTPEPTTTGAVRLEDKKAGVVWLQIPTKSMLMNSKIGQRMVDACVHPAQVAHVATTAPADSGIGIAPAAPVAAAR